MHEQVIFSGFGGQGALFAGQLLTYAGMDAGWQVTWIPSYGPEMRGGTANCTVILSDQPIGSPIIRNPTIAVVLNPPSMEKYESLVKPGGVLVINSTLVKQQTVRDDIEAVYGAQINARLAKNLRGKLLLITGDMDDNVHPALTLQVANALIAANKDFDLLMLPNRNHQTSFRDPYVLRRLWDYFVRHLLEAEPPAGYRIRGPEEDSAAPALESASV